MGSGCVKTAVTHRGQASHKQKKNNHMFEIQLGPSGEVVMAGRLDATQCDAALRFLDGLADLRVIDLARLEYIASSGLRVFLLTQKRARGSGSGLKLINVSPQVHDIFRYAGFDRVIDMTRAAG
jgi:anti-anti-sigma factor